MQFARTLLALILLAITTEVAQAGIIDIPSDIGVTLTASPTTDLLPGQPIDMTLSVTNYGPESEPIVIVSSTVFVDELNVVETNFDECAIQLVVGDLANGDYDYRIDWTVAGLGGVAPPIAAGETRICHFGIALTQHAPSPYTFAFDLVYVSDPNPGNDNAAVVLTRAAAPPPQPVPTLSTAMLGLLAALSAGLAALALRCRSLPS
jgi:hypothetical protein